jgi:hypothetical protein
MELKAINRKSFAGCWHFTHCAGASQNCSHASCWLLAKSSWLLAKIFCWLLANLCWLLAKQLHPPLIQMFNSSGLAICAVPLGINNQRQLLDSSGTVPRGPWL